MAKQGTRLSRTVEKQSKKQLYIFLAGTILIIALLVAVGPRLIELIGNLTVNNTPVDINQEDSIEVVQPPQFESLPNATDKGNITIKGTVVGQNGKVQLYVNNKLFDEQTVHDSLSFSFSSVKLKEGDNTIKARYLLSDRKSDFTKDYIVTYSKEPPKIENVSPGDGTEFKRGDQEIEITGTTDAKNSVTVNGSRAIVDENGKFSYFLKLNEGDNTIHIVAANPAGVETSKDIKVSYHP